MSRARIRAQLGRLLRDLRRPEATSGADQWQRVTLNRSIAAHIAALDPPSRSAAEISGDAYASLPWSGYASLMYPEFDLCAPLTERRRFDVVICEQVLEHVVDPCAAAANLRKLCASRAGT